MRIQSASERRLMRLLHGELPPDEARRLERRLEQDAELRAAYDRLAETWAGLELPEPGEAPAGFAAGVMGAARKVRGGELSWSLAPLWARAGSTAALLAGLLLGATFGGDFAQPAPEAVVEYADADADAIADAVPLSLAEAYWLALEESGGLLEDADGSEESVR